MAGGANADAGVGTGGMATKLAAARIAAAAGCATLITLGRRARAAAARWRTARRATLFEPLADARPPPTRPGSPARWPRRARWWSTTARRRRCAPARACWPAGVQPVEGRFDKGDAVVVRDLAGREIGRGLARYDAADAATHRRPAVRGHRGGARLHRRPADPRRRSGAGGARRPSQRPDAPLRRVPSSAAGPPAVRPTRAPLRAGLVAAPRHAGRPVWRLVQSGARGPRPRGRDGAAAAGPRPGDLAGVAAESAEGRA